MPVETPIIRSAVLRGNPLGDPAERRLAVYLPPGYAHGRERYAVVYLLSGFAARGTMFLNESAWDETIAERLDRLITSGAVQPLIVAMPDAMTRLGGSQYLNSSATGRYEDHVVEEVVPFVDATYRTHATRERRALVGKSSGGYGATVLAMRHPDVFGCAADHAGDKYFEYCYKHDFPKALAGLAPYGHSAAEFLKGFPHPRPARGPFWFDTANILAMASCYSPNPASPTGFDLPFDERTGEVRADVWARWLAHDPVELVAAHAGALRSLRLYYLDCGRRDEHHLQYGTRVYVRRLEALGIPHVYEEFDGGHFGTSFRYDVSLRLLSAALG
jgi:enterochelin esterase family protein